MTVIAWDVIRRELDQAQALIQYETADSYDNPRIRIRAADHIRTALLLLGGSTPSSIICHAPGTHHDDREDTAA